MYDKPPSDQFVVTVLMPINESDKKWVFLIVVHIVKSGYPKKNYAVSIESLMPYYLNSNEQ